MLPTDGEATRRAGSCEFEGLVGRPTWDFSAFLPRIDDRRIPKVYVFLPRIDDSNKKLI